MCEIWLNMTFVICLEYDEARLLKKKDGTRIF